VYLQWLQQVTKAAGCQL